MKKEIIEKNAIDKIVNQLFGSIPVYVKFFDKEYPIKVVSLKPQGLVVKLPVKMEKGTRILTVVHNNYKFTGEFSYLGGDASGYELLSPVKFNIEEAKRETKRVVVENREESSGLTVINIINMIDVNKAIGFADKRVEALVLAVDAKLKESYPESSLYLSARMDNRLRMMYNYDKSIFVADRFDGKGVGADFLPFDEYQKIIRMNKIRENQISEISVMIKYKGYTPLGYIQVLSEHKLTTGDYNNLQVLAATLSKGIGKTGIFPESKEICHVNDISFTGLSFMHPQSRFFSKSFAVGETIFFDILLNNELKGTFRSIIRNIKNTEKDFRVGTQFYNLQPKEIEFLESIIEERDRNAPAETSGNIPQEDHDEEAVTDVTSHTEAIAEATTEAVAEEE